MKRLAACVVAVVFGLGETAWAQTPAPPPGYRQETIQILVPDTPATAPMQNLPASPGQLPSATASATGFGARANASVDAFPGLALQPQRSFEQGDYQSRVQIRDRWIHQRLTTTVYPSGPALLPQPRQIRCRGNLFGMCRCPRHVSHGAGIGVGVNTRVGWGAYH